MIGWQCPICGARKSYRQCYLPFMADEQDRSLSCVIALTTSCTLSTSSRTGRHKA